MTEWNASDYNHFSALQKVMAEQELRRLRLTGSERVLDVGCGDGKVTAEIARLVPGGSVLGVDPSHNMIAFASGHFPPIAHANLRFEVADVRQLGFRAEFDLAVSFNALHWVPEQELALSRIRAALKPGGRALLLMVPRQRGAAIEYVLEELRSCPRWERFFPGFRPPIAHFTPEEYRAMAERAGFIVDHIQVEEHSWEFPSRAAFAAFCDATFAEWTRMVHEPDRAAFIEDVLDHYRAAACPGAGEENVLKFVQMEAALVARNPHSTA